MGRYVKMDRTKMRDNGDQLDEPLATADVGKQWESRCEGEQRTMMTIAITTMMFSHFV